MLEIITSPTFQLVLVGTVVLGAVSAIVGCFALLRRQSLVGDALAHAALPGVCGAFLLAGSKSSTWLLGGALVSGLLGALFILLVVRASRIKEDSAIGIVLSVFFALGIVMLSLIQRSGAANQSGLDHFLFGQAATLLERDVWIFSGAAVVVIALVGLFFKELKLVTFDRDFAASFGLPVRRLEIVLTCLLVVIVVLGLQTVGVVLMVASLITPAAAARQWTDRLGAMLLIAAVIGGLSNALGTTLSAAVERLPTGPTIVITSSVLLVISICFAPRRGMLWSWLATQRLRDRIRCENLLKDLYAWGERNHSWDAFVAAPELMGVRGIGSWQLARTRQAAHRRGLIRVRGDHLQLTEDGLAAAQNVVRKHRLWEVYLTHRLEIASDHVHRDAEAMEHVLSDDAVAEFEAMLGHPTVDPHGRPIPPAPSRLGEP